MKKKTYYYIVTILLIIIAYIIYFNNKTKNDLPVSTEVSIITLDEYRYYVENYNNKSTADYFQDEYMKIKHTETKNGIRYRYGIVFPYHIWQSRKYNEIQKYTIYFVDEYSSMFNKYDLSAIVGNINIEPNNVFRVGLQIQSTNLNKIINPQNLNDLDYLSFRFTEYMINMSLQILSENL